MREPNIGSVEAFSAQVVSRNGVVRIAVSGELDMASVPVLTERLQEVEREGTRGIMLDLRALSFIDVSGLHAFLHARARASENGHRLSFLGANPAVRRVFELTATEFLLDGPETVGLLDRFTSGHPSATVCLEESYDVR